MLRRFTEIKLQRLHRQRNTATFHWQSDLLELLRSYKVGSASLPFYFNVELKLLIIIIHRLGRRSDRKAIKTLFISHRTLPSLENIIDCCAFTANFSFTILWHRISISTFFKCSLPPLSVSFSLRMIKLIHYNDVWYKSAWSICAGPDPTHLIEVIKLNSHAIRLSHTIRWHCVGGEHGRWQMRVAMANWDGLELSDEDSGGFIQMHG